MHRRRYSNPQPTTGSFSDKLNFWRAKEVQSTRCEVGNQQRQPKPTLSSRIHSKKTSRYLASIENKTSPESLPAKSASPTRTRSPQSVSKSHTRHSGRKSSRVKSNPTFQAQRFVSAPIKSNPAPNEATTPSSPKDILSHIKDEVRSSPKDAFDGPAPNGTRERAGGISLVEQDAAKLSNNNGAHRAGIDSLNHPNEPEATDLNLPTSSPPNVVVRPQMHSPSAASEIVCTETTTKSQCDKPAGRRKIADVYLQSLKRSKDTSSNPTARESVGVVNSPVVKQTIRFAKLDINPTNTLSKVDSTDVNSVSNKDKLDENRQQHKCEQPNSVEKEASIDIGLSPPKRSVPEATPNDSVEAAPARFSSSSTLEAYSDTALMPVVERSRTHEFWRHSIVGSPAVDSFEESSDYQWTDKGDSERSYGTLFDIGSGSDELIDECDDDELLSELSDSEVKPKLDCRPNSIYSNVSVSYEEQAAESAVPISPDNKSPGDAIGSDDAEGKHSSTPLVDGPIVHTSLPNPSDKKRRERVQQEFIESERTYVSNLHLLVSVFARPLKTDESLGLTQADASDMFMNIELLYKLHKDVLHDLENEQHFSQVVLNYSNSFRVYAHYLHGYETSLQVIDKNRNNKRFQSFLKLCREDPRCRGHDMMSFLILPVQRIPRYELLLKEYLKFVRPNETAERAKIEKAVAAMHNIAAFINESKREFEHMSHLMRVQNRIQSGKGKSYSIIRTGRRILFHGLCRELKLNAMRVRTMRKIDIYVFNDVLLCLERRGTRVRYMNRLQHLSCQEITIRSMFGVEISSPETGKDAMTFVFAKAETRDEFLRTLARATEAIQADKRVGSKHVSIEDANAVMKHTLASVGRTTSNSLSKELLL